VELWWIVLPAAIALAAAALYLAKQRRAARLRQRRRVAIDDFRTRRGELEPIFLHAAQATGKPRGLRWKACRLQANERFAVDRATGELYALVGATISFEAIEGGGMEDVEAVGNLRYATAVFVHRNGVWSSDGRAVFNLDPAQALERFSDALEPLADD
jgi:hypothetical protein